MLTLQSLTIRVMFSLIELYDAKQVPLNIIFN